MKTFLFPTPGVKGILVLAVLMIAATSADAQSTGTSSSRTKATPEKEEGFFEKLGNLFSRPTKREVTAHSRTQQTYAATRTTNRYYNAPAATYLANEQGTVIYQGQSRGPETPQPMRQPLRPGESITITSSGTVYRTANGIDSAVTTVPGTETFVDPAPQPVVTPTPQPTPPPPPPKALIDKESLPVAKWSGTYGRVISPYPPHHELDVTGLPPGSLARDPATRLIFRLP